MPAKISEEWVRKAESARSYLAQRAHPIYGVSCDRFFRYLGFNLPKGLTSKASWSDTLKRFCTYLQWKGIAQFQVTFPFIPDDPIRVYPYGKLPQPSSIGQKPGQRYSRRMVGVDFGESMPDLEISKKGVKPDEIEGDEVMRALCDRVRRTPKQQAIESAVIRLYQEIGGNSWLTTTEIYEVLRKEICWIKGRDAVGLALNNLARLGFLKRGKRAGLKVFGAISADEKHFYIGQTCCYLLGSKSERWGTIARLDPHEKYGLTIVIQTENGTVLGSPDLCSVPAVRVQNSVEVALTA